MKIHKAILCSLAVAFMSITLNAQLIKEYEIPEGWVFKKAGTLKNGFDCILIWPDIPDEQKRAAAFPSRLMIFDDAGRPINDITLDKPSFFSNNRDEKIILDQGNSIEVLDPYGRTLFCRETGGRFPQPSLLGKDIGLIYRDPGGDFIEGPVSIIDGMTGRELITLTLPSGHQLKGFTGFLPIGDGGHFLISMGATVLLQTYKEPGKTIWSIPDIGGNVVDIYPVDDRYAAVQYQDLSGRKNNNLRAGFSVIEWRSGKVIFNQESSDPAHGEWKGLHGTGMTFLMRGKDLCLLEEGEGSALIIPGYTDKQGWDATKMERKPLSSHPERSLELSGDNKHTVIRNGRKIRLEPFPFLKDN